MKHNLGRQVQLRLVLNSTLHSNMPRDRHSGQLSMAAIGNRMRNAVTNICTAGGTPLVQPPVRPRVTASWHHEVEST